MKPNEHSQIEFIKDYLRNGWERKNILQEFTKIYKVSIKTFDTRLKAATKAIQTELDIIRNKVDDSVIKQSEALKLKIMSQVEVDAKLCDIISGKPQLVQLLNSQGKVFKAEITPSLADITKAIDLYNKRFGSNAPAVIKQDGEMVIKVIRE